MTIKYGTNPDNPYRLSESCQIPFLDDIYYKYFGIKTDGFFVEVGAFDGYNWSNTYGLFEMGWSGILVEPQPEYAAKCRSLYAGQDRVHVYECACGATNETVDLYIGGSLTTTKADMVGVYNSIDWARFSGLDLNKTIKVQMYTLDYLIETYGVWLLDQGIFMPDIDVLVIDVEGAEMDVLNGFSIDVYHPRMLIVETHEKYPDDRLNHKAVEVNDFLQAHGYEKVQSDTINSIFWRER